MFLCEAEEREVEMMQTVEQRRKQPSLVDGDWVKLTWSRSVPDRKGIWLRLNSKKKLVIHRVTVVNPFKKPIELMIDWGTGNQIGLIAITPKSTRRKLEGWLWYGPISFYPPDTLPIQPRISLEPPL